MPSATPTLYTPPNQHQLEEHGICHLGRGHPATSLPPPPGFPKSESKHHLGDPFDLLDDWYGGTALVVRSKTNVPQV